MATRNSEDDVYAVSTEQKTTTKQDLDGQMNVQPPHTLTHTHARAHTHSISLIHERMGCHKVISISRTQNENENNPPPPPKKKKKEEEERKRLIILAKPKHKPQCF